MVVTIKVTITKLTKKLFCINYFQKYIYSATKFIFSPLFFPHSTCVTTGNPSHTRKRTHAPPHVNINTSVSAANKINHRHTETVGPLLSHSYGIRLALYTSITTKYLICISPLAKDTATGVIRGEKRKMLHQLTAAQTCEPTQGGVRETLASLQQKKSGQKINANYNIPFPFTESLDIRQPSKGKG